MAEGIINNSRAEETLRLFQESDREVPSLTLTKKQNSTRSRNAASLQSTAKLDYDIATTKSKYVNSVMSNKRLSVDIANDSEKLAKI
jgi:hypothetical protein